MYGFQMRMDARLVPVSVQLPAELADVAAEFAMGVYDCSPFRDAIARELRRAALVSRARFNDHLNRLLAAYGLHVTPVQSPDEEMAIAYLGGYGVSEALEQAREVRDWFIPAAQVSYPGDADLVVDLLPLVISQQPCTTGSMCA